MKAQRLLLSLALVACVGLMYSCKDDDESNDNLTQEQTETAINEASLTFSTSCEEISSNEYYDVFETFKGLFSYYKSNGVRVPQMKKPAINFSNLPSSIKLEQINYFSFNTYIELFYVYSYVENENGEILPGTYILNENGELVEYTATPNDAIVIEFPYNNGSASITSNIDVDSEGYLLSADCDVAIDGTTIYTGTYVGTSSSLDIDITMGEYTFAFNYSYDEGETIYSNSTTTIKKNGTTVYGESSTITYNTDFDFVGKVIIGGIEFRVSLLATEEQFSNPTLDYDEIATMELYTTSGDKLGHFEFEGAAVWFYYNDGVRISPEILMPEIYAQCFTFFYSQIAG